MMIYRLVYYSANRIVGTDRELPQAVDEILAASRRNNAMWGSPDPDVQFGYLGRS